MKETRMKKKTQKKVTKKKVNPLAITAADIRSAKKADACSGALVWAKEKPRTWRQLLHQRPSWAQWAVLNIPDLREPVRSMFFTLGVPITCWDNGCRSKIFIPALGIFLYYHGDGSLKMEKPSGEA